MNRSPALLRRQEFNKYKIEFLIYCHNVAGENYGISSQAAAKRRERNFSFLFEFQQKLVSIKSFVYTKNFTFQIFFSIRSISEKPKNILDFLSKNRYILINHQFRCKQKFNQCRYSMKSNDKYINFC